jgi:hypothetical protein
MMRYISLRKKKQAAVMTGEPKQTEVSQTLTSEQAPVHHKVYENV